MKGHQVWGEPREGSSTKLTSPKLVFRRSWSPGCQCQSSGLRSGAAITSPSARCESVLVLRVVQSRQSSRLAGARASSKSSSRRGRSEAVNMPYCNAIAIGHECHFAANIGT